MTAQELAQHMLTIAQQALDTELKEAIYINDDPGKCEARDGLEAIITLCKGVLPAQEGFRQYEKKVRRERES